MIYLQLVHAKLVETVQKNVCQLLLLLNVIMVITYKQMKMKMKFHVKHALKITQKHVTDLKILIIYHVLMDILLSQVHVLNVNKELLESNHVI